MDTRFIMEVAAEAGRNEMTKLSKQNLQQLAKKIGGDIIVEQIFPDNEKETLLGDAQTGAVMAPTLKDLRAGRARAASLRGNRRANLKVAHLKVDFSTGRSKVLQTDIAIKVRPKSGEGPEKIMLLSGKTKNLLLQQG